MLISLHWRSGRLVFIASLLALLAASGPVAAETLFAPVGGRSVRIGADRMLCDAGTANNGWTIDPDGHGARPPTRDTATTGQTTVLHTASDASQCTASTATIALLATAPFPTIDLASVTVDADAGEVLVRGHNLRDAVLHWEAGGRSGDDHCTSPQVSTGQDTCTFAIAHGVPADATAIEIFVLPPGVHWGADVVSFDAMGRRLSADDWRVHPARVTIGNLVPTAATVETQAGVARVHLPRPEAIAAIDCTDAACDLEAGDLVIRGEHGGDDQLELHMRLRPHVFLRTGTALDGNPLLTLPLQRCPIALASAPPLRRIADQRVVLRIGGQCAHDPDLRFSTSWGALPAQLATLTDDQRMVIVQVDHLDADDFPITVSRGGSVAGVVHLRASSPPVIRARLELAGLGPIDFIPTNRDARVLVPAGLSAGHVVPVPVEGVYTVAHDSTGFATVRGVEGTAGSVALHLAYRDPGLPPALRDLDLAVLIEPVDRQIRVANVPVAIAASAAGRAPFVEMLCGDGHGRTRSVVPGVTLSIPFRARDTCRVLLHRESLHAEDGAQAIHLSVDVFESDGSPRPEAKIDQTLLVRRSSEPRVLYVTGVRSPFDRVIVRVALASDDAHWSLAPDERVGAPQVQWSVVTGTDRFRIYGTTAIPTGLFRVSGDNSGIMALNAGALFRLVWLSREGLESPIGLEAGAMWIGIAGPQCAGPSTPACSALGEAAVVAGVGLSVPIANPSHATQTSISVHAWFEYEASRALRAGGGMPVGFVFGPSISIGNIGSNF